MKKWMYLVTGAVIGALVATAGSAFADQVKSMIGKKVTGEYTVIVDGKELEDKGAVIEGRTNVPVRGMAKALGVDFKVEGKKIIVMTEDGAESTTPSSSISSGNKYFGQPKSSLENNKDIIENRILKPTIEGRHKILAEVQLLKESLEKYPEIDDSSLIAKEKQLKEYDAIIEENTKELELINEALAALNKK